MKWILKNCHNTQSYEEKKAQSLEALGKLIETLKQDYKKVFLIFHPTKMQVQNNSSAILEYDAVAQEHHITFFSLIDTYKTAYAKGYNVHADQIHLSPEGTSLLARSLQQLIHNDTTL